MVNPYAIFDYPVAAETQRNEANEIALMNAFDEVNAELALFVNCEQKATKRLQRRARDSAMKNHGVSEAELDNAVVDLCVNSPIWSTSIAHDIFFDKAARLAIHLRSTNPLGQSESDKPQGYGGGW